MVIGTDSAGGSVRADVFASGTAFEAWYERSLPKVFGYVYARCGRDADLAEEITQQAFVEAVRDRSGFVGRSDPVTWVVGIARHRLVDHFRRCDREERRWFRLRVRDLHPDVPDAWARIDEREAVTTALASLPALQRAALTFTVLDGLSVRETAGLLGKSESAVESLLSRARAGFRAAYADAGGSGHG